MNAARGRRCWALAAGCAPSRSTGPEPEFCSCDLLRLLNTGHDHANVRITLLYADHGEVGPYRIVVAPRRLRAIRINDLIFPEAVRLDEAYGLLLESDAPVVVQFSRQDTRQRANAGAMTFAWPAAPMRSPPARIADGDDAIQSPPSARDG